MNTFFKDLRRSFPSGKRGFTLLLAALVSSIVLSLGSSIFLIAKKQITLSSIGRDSQFAFYAADTGAECALYWDVRYDAFGTTTLAAVPTCDGKELNAAVESGTFGTRPYVVEFRINLFSDQSTGYCTDVTIYKNTSNPYTVIHADGYSTTCEAMGTNNRALQRSVELHY
ncbi:MAG: hypothetical protein WC050_02000 [Candidatus Paceibacterota bacterium]